MRMRLLPPLAALLLGVAAAFVVACGNDDNLIPPSDASRVENALDEVAADFRAGNCQAAEAAVAKARGALLNLPDSVDSRLRARLRSGVAKLAERIPATCGQAQTETQPPETQTETQETQTETQTTETETTDTETTETEPTDTSGTTTGETTTDGTTTGGTTTDDGTGGVTPGEG